MNSPVEQVLDALASRPSDHFGVQARMSHGPMTLATSGTTPCWAQVFALNSAGTEHSVGWVAGSKDEQVLAQAIEMLVARPQNPQREMKRLGIHGAGQVMPGAVQVAREMLEVAPSGSVDVVVANRHTGNAIRANHLRIVATTPSAGPGVPQPVLGDADAALDWLEDGGPIEGTGVFVELAGVVRTRRHLLHAIEVVHPASGARLSLNPEKVRLVQSGLASLHPAHPLAVQAGIEAVSGSVERWRALDAGFSLLTGADLGDVAMENHLEVARVVLRHRQRWVEATSDGLIESNQTHQSSLLALLRWLG